MIWVMKATLYFRGHGTSLDITDTPTINKIISRHDKKINYGQDLKTSSLLPPLVINRGSERKIDPLYNRASRLNVVDYFSLWLALKTIWPLVVCENPGIPVGICFPCVWQVTWPGWMHQSAPTFGAAMCICLSAIHQIPSHLHILRRALRSPGEN